MPDQRAQDQEPRDPLVPQILKAPGPIWTKIKQFLGVETREEAVSAVQANPEARQAVATLLTAPAKRSQSFLASPKRQATPLAELMYGKGGAKVTF